MNYLKDLFGKGRFGVYIGFALVIEGQRRYLLPNTNLYKKLKQTAIEEFKFI